jgi:hypothetical protein
MGTKIYHLRYTIQFLYVESFYGELLNVESFIVESLNAESFNVESFNIENHGTPNHSTVKIIKNRIFKTSKGIQFYSKTSTQVFLGEKKNRTWFFLFI